MSSNHKSVAFYEAGSWYYRLKTLQEDGTTKYSKKVGFAIAEEAEESYQHYEVEFVKACRNYRVPASADFEFREYLINWLEEIYTQRIENITRMLAAYVVYDMILPNMNQGTKLWYISAEYLDALLARVAKVCESAGNKSRELNYL